MFHGYVRDFCLDENLLKRTPRKENKEMKGFCRSKYYILCSALKTNSIIQLKERRSRNPQVLKGHNLLKSIIDFQRVKNFDLNIVDYDLNEILSTAERSEKK